MKPLLKDKQQRHPKWRAEKTDHVGGFSKGVSNYDKLTTRNANRTMTKGARQETKKEIREILNKII